MDPPSIVPYKILVCCERSSADSMGDTMRSTVRNAARFAVYDEMMMSVKNHHMPPTIRVDTARGLMSEPCCISVPTANQNAFDSVKMFSSSALSGLHGCGLYHSYGLNRASTYIIMLTTCTSSATTAAVAVGLQIKPNQIYLQHKINGQEKYNRAKENNTYQNK